MQSQKFQSIDFCGVWANQEAILDKIKLPRFSNWWESFIDSMRKSERPSLESVSFVYAITGDEELGQKAISLLRETIAGYIPLTSHSEYYPELRSGSEIVFLSVLHHLSGIYSIMILTLFQSRQIIFLNADYSKAFT